MEGLGIREAKALVRRVEGGSGFGVKVLGLSGLRLNLTLEGMEEWGTITTITSILPFPTNQR